MRSLFIFAASIGATSLFVNVAFADNAAPSPPSHSRGDEKSVRPDLDEPGSEYTAFADICCGDLRSPHAFAQAAILDFRLGRYEMRLSRYVEYDMESPLREFENKFGAAHVDEWSEIAFTMADGLANRQDRANALSILNRVLTVQSKWLVEAEKKKGADTQLLREIELRARARLAHAYTDAGDHVGAGVEYARIMKLAAKLGVWPGKKPARAKAKHSETMDFIAESYYYAAEQKRFEAERMTLPPYLGKGERESVLEFVTNAGARWQENRKYTVENAVYHYVFVLGVEWPKPEPPKPPPPRNGMIGLLGGDPNAPQIFASRDPIPSELPSAKWAIAAAERLGKLWSSFAQEIIRMPIPGEWKGSGLVPGTDLTYEDLKGEFACGGIESPTEIVKQQARAAYRFCLNLSIQHRIVNEHTQACIHWLARNYGAEYHEVDEFVPPGEFVALGQYARPAPLPKFTH